MHESRGLGDVYKRQPQETLAYHKLDGCSLAERIAGIIGKQ